MKVVINNIEGVLTYTLTLPILARALSSLYLRKSSSKYSKVLLKWCKFSVNINPFSVTFVRKVQLLAQLQTVCLKYVSGQRLTLQNFFLFRIRILSAILCYIYIFCWSFCTADSKLCFHLKTNKKSIGN